MRKVLYRLHLLHNDRVCKVSISPMQPSTIAIDCWRSIGTEASLEILKRVWRLPMQEGHQMVTGWPNQEILVPQPSSISHCCWPAFRLQMISLQML